MRTQNVSQKSAQPMKAGYAAATAAALILTMVLGLFGAIPGVAVAAPAGDEPSSFSSQAEAIEYFVAKQRASRQSGDELVTFSSQAEAIEYLVAKQSASRQGGDELVSFSSQAEAIGYFVAKQGASRQGGDEIVSFLSQAEAIEYFVAQNRLQRAANAAFTCSGPDSFLAANPEVMHVWQAQSC